MSSKQIPPLRTPPRFSDSFLDETIAVWQPHSKDMVLTRDDARKIATNLVGFFELLIQMDRADCKRKAMSEEQKPVGDHTSPSEQKTD